MFDRFEQFTTAVFSIYQSILKVQRAEMAKYGLKGAHTQCLLAMLRCSEGVTVTQLGKLCERDKAAISRTVAELEKLGMVRLVDETAGHYRARLCLTEQGAEAAQQIHHRAALAVHRAGAGLTEANREVLYFALERIAGNLQTICRNGLEE